MKRNTLVYCVIMIAAIVFSTSACHKKVEKMETKKFELDKTVYLTDNKIDSLTISLDIEFPIAAPIDSIVPKVQQQIERQLFGDDYVGKPLDVAMAAYHAELAADYRETNLPILQQLEANGRTESNTIALNNEHMLTAYTMYNDKQVYSYAIERYVFMGGAHGINTRFFSNFNMATGDIITENDLFVSDFQLPLTALLIQSLVEQNDDLALISDLKESDYEIDAIHPNNNFYISEDGITYVFNPYDIGPYYLGETEILIKADKLMQLLKPEWSYLFANNTKK